MNKFTTGLFGAAVSMSALGGCSNNPEAKATEVAATNTVAPTYDITAPETTQSVTTETSTTLISYTNSELQNVQCEPVKAEDVMYFDGIMNFATEQEMMAQNLDGYYNRMAIDLTNPRLEIGTALCSYVFSFEDMPTVNNNDQPVGEPFHVTMNGSVTEEGNDFIYNNTPCVVTGLMGNFDDSMLEFTPGEIEGQSVVEVAC